MTSADVIRLARRRAGLTQAELAERIGRPRPNVTRWEGGKTQPSFETLMEIVRACDLEAELSFFPYDDSNDGYVWELLELEPAERVKHQIALVQPPAGPDFDPIGLFGALREHEAQIVLMGKLAAAARGCPVLPRERELVVLLAETAGNELDLQRGLAAVHAESLTSARLRPGDFAFEARPAPTAERWRVDAFGADLAVLRGRPHGTRGAEDILPPASVLAIDGVRVPVPDLLDLIRIADASPDAPDKIVLPTLRRALEFEAHPPVDRSPKVPEGLEELFARAGVA